MTPTPLDELHFLVEALTAHAEWSQATGGDGLPACDATWLEARREHYRNTAYVPVDEPDDVDAAPSFDAIAASGTATSGTATSPIATPTLAAGSAAPLHLSDAQGSTRDALPDGNTPVSPAAPRIESAQVSPRATAPSTLSTEIAAVVGQLAAPPEPAAPTSDSAAGPATRAPAPMPVFEFPGAPPPKRVARPQPPPVVVSPVPERPSIVPAATVEERRVQLQTLEAEVRGCKSCSLCEERTKTVFARGDGSIGVAFVGEGPGADEDAQGYPFVGAAGQLLDKMIAAMGLSRDAVYVCNIVKCRPPKNRKPTEEEMATCRPFVVSQLDLIQPRVIVALGATAVEGLLGLKMGITRMRGTWRLYKGTIPVMPTFHPAYLLRQPDAKREVWEDLQAVLARINMPLPQRR